MQNPNEDTEWNDILRKHGILPPRPKTPPSPSPPPSPTTADKLKGASDSALKELEDDAGDSETERIVQEYRRKRMQEFRKAEKRGRFGEMLPIGRDDYKREVTEASKIDEEGAEGKGRGQPVVCYLYKDGDAACSRLTEHLKLLASRYPSTKFAKNTEVEVVGLGNSFKTTLTGIEMFHKELDRGEAGDNMGALLRGIKREQIKRGQVLCAPGSMKSAKKFQAQVYVLSKDEGGRYTPFMSNYRPQLFIRTADVTVGLTFPPGTENPDEKMVMPGDNVELVGDLVHDVAMEKGSRFTLREGGKTIGTGIVTEIFE